MRVAVISHACVVDVNQRLFNELCRHDDVELLLVAPRRWRASTGMIVDFTPVAGARFIARPLPVIGSGQISLHLYRGLAPVLRAFAPDVIYLDEEPYSLPAWQVLRICRRHGFPLCFMTAQNLVKRFPWPFSRVERAMLDYAALAVPPTDEVADVLRAKHFQGEIVVVPHFVDTDLFRPLERSELRRELGLRGTVVGYVGRLTVEKGLDDLTAAMEMLWRRGMEVSVLIIGGGPLMERLREWSRAQPPGRVALTGPVPHSAVPDYLNVADIMAVPSRTMPNWKEQFGRVLIEAPACAIPVVGSSSGNIPHLIEELGSGVVFEERNPEALADALQGLIEDPERRRQLAEVGRRRAQERYGLAAVADRLYEALSGMLRRPRTLATARRAAASSDGCSTKTR